ncbi:Eco29kI family restriction endonuclease [Deinococcus sp. YIM 134068]|uniref:Eco29kI family restriction endonuclease n=1 Tax=Deinococcus lichenicola TaxID=3118910 RepID=UPI002F933B8F
MIRKFVVPENLEADLLAFYEAQEVYPLRHLEQMRGELGLLLGAYALFYTGPFDLYAPVVAANQQGFIQPLYIGKAVPKGDRTGESAKKAVLENSLHKRLYEHTRSISQAENLDVADFSFRVVPTTLHLSAWVESVLISQFVPAWNRHIDGFGNHDPGSGRYNQRRSVWDQIHPGRSWASRMANLALYDLAELRERISARHHAREVRLEEDLEQMSEQ